MHMNTYFVYIKSQEEFQQPDHKKKSKNVRQVYKRCQKCIYSYVFWIGKKQQARAAKKNSSRQAKVSG